MTGAVGGRIGDRDLDEAAGRQGRTHLLTEQAQEGEPLPLGNEVGTIEDGVAQPGEQVDQGAAGVAVARIGPFGRVRRDAADEVGDQIIEAAIVECGWPNRHQAPPTGTLADT